MLDFGQTSGALRACVNAALGGQCQEGGETPKPPRKAVSSRLKTAGPAEEGQVWARSPNESCRNQTGTPGRSELLRGIQTTPPAAPGAPSRFTPSHATGTGKKGRGTGVKDITSKWPLTCRSHTRSELFTQNPNLQGSPHPGHRILQGSPKAPQPDRPSSSPHFSGACVAKNKQNLLQALSWSPSAC